MLINADTTSLSPDLWGLWGPEYFYSRFSQSKVPVTQKVLTLDRDCHFAESVNDFSWIVAAGTAHQRVFPPHASITPSFAAL